MKFKNEAYNPKTDLFFGICALICFLLSSSVFPFISGFASMPCPDLLLCFCCILPRFCDTKRAAIYAVILGFLSDLFINIPYMFSPVIYLISVLITPYFYRYFNRTGTVMAAVCALPALLLHKAVETVIIMITRQTAVLGTIIWKNTLPHLIIDFAFVILLGFIMRSLARIFGVQKNG